MPKKVVSGKTRGRRSENVQTRGGVSSNFLKVLTDDFDAHGRDVIASMRVNEPAAYLRLAASILPKDPAAKRPVEEMSDEALHSLIEGTKLPEAAASISGKQNRPRAKSRKSVG